jgi:hypothetical protein
VAALRSAGQSIVDTGRQVGKMLNEALSTVSYSSRIEEIKLIEQSLRTVPFRMYQESAIVALKKGIPLDQYEAFIINRIAPRYNLPQKHIEELVDSMYCELNQVSITEFYFQQEEDGDPAETPPNTFSFCRMVVLRREKNPGEQVLDLGYCFFNVKFNFGDERVVREIMEDREETIPKKFLWFTVGYDTKRVQTRRQVEEFKKFQMDFGKKDEMQEYFRYKAVNALSQDALQKGEEAEMKHQHSGIHPIKDEVF